MLFVLYHSLLKTTVAEFCAKRKEKNEPETIDFVQLLHVHCMIFSFFAFYSTFFSKAAFSLN